MSTVTTERARPFRILSGVGAGAGASVVMMAVMAGLRFATNLPTIPELMVGPIINFLGGQSFSDQLDKLYYAGRPLLFTLIVEGTLLLGVVLGLLYAFLARPNPITDKRPAIFNSTIGGVLYGLAIGILLNVLFLPIISLTVFASQSPGTGLASPVPLWAGLMLLALVYGVTLHWLLPSAPPQEADGVGMVSASGKDGTGHPYLGYEPPKEEILAVESADRRQVLRIAGGTALALLGGTGLFGTGTLLNQGGVISPVNRVGTKNPDNAGVAPNDNVAQVIEVPTPQSAAPTETITPEPTPIPTDTPLPPSPTEVPTLPPPTNTPQPPTAEPSPTTIKPTQPPTKTPKPLPTNTAKAKAAPTRTPRPTSAPPPSATPLPPSDTPVPTVPKATEPPPPTNTPVPADTAIVVNTPSIPVIKVREITPTTSFYHISKNFFDPNVSTDGWNLEIRGMVDNPYSLSYVTLTYMTPVEVTTGMMCISNPVGGGLIGNTTWKGVRLADLLARANPRPGVKDVVMRAADDYSDSITYEKALDPDVLLVWEMGGARLTSEHGFPARLLVPGIYGMKHVKWIQSFELVDYDFKGYWQQPSQNWNDAAPVKVMSRIDFPAEGTLDMGPLDLSGVAFAGDRSISKVEISTNSGKTWKQAYLKPPLSQTSWVLWGYTWTPPGAGTYKIMVRATDGEGNLQAAKRADPFPSGATGYHTVTFKVKG